MSLPLSSLRTRLTAVELAFGTALGVDHEIGAIEHGEHPHPRAALEACVVAALSRPPCVVSFSGGRDSSALLALAVSVARRDGYDDPIPATLIFPDAPETDESDWQQLVVQHLALKEWHRIAIEGDRFDAVGPVAAPLLVKHGLLWPFNTFFHQPILEAAAGGSVLTGLGGDELANSTRTRRAARILRNRGPVRLSSLLVLGFAFAPAALRRRVIQRRFDSLGRELSWLTAEGRRAVAAAYAADEVNEHWRWDRVLRDHIARARYFTLAQSAFETLGQDHGVAVRHPFVHPWVTGSLARTYGKVGPATRSDLMRALFGDLLPERTITRATKATFTSPLFTEISRDFARDWSGAVPAGDLVDPAALRAMWQGSATPDARSAPLLQAAWLHDHLNRA